MPEIVHDTIFVTDLKESSLSYIHPLWTSKVSNKSQQGLPAAVTVSLSSQVWVTVSEWVYDSFFSFSNRCAMSYLERVAWISMLWECLESWAPGIGRWEVFIHALNPGLQEWVSGSSIHALPHTKKIMFSCIVKGKLPVFCMSLQARSYLLAPLPFYMFLADRSHAIRSAPR